jgi:uncharacterized repeat protein (TIGR01451 family)
VAAIAAVLSILGSAPSSLAAAFVQTGVYTGTGNPALSVTGLGFRPDLVIVKSAESKSAFAVTSSMPAGNSKNTAKGVSLQTNRIVSLDPDGFTVGDNVDINKAGTQFYWVAMQALDGVLEVGEYTGTGIDAQPVPLANMTPEAVLVLPAHDELPVLRQADMYPWTAYALDNSGAAYSSIVGFGPNRFEVSPNRSTNEAGRTYYYVAWQTQPGSLAAGFYYGNGQSARTVSGLDVDPEYVLIANSTGEYPIHRPASLTGDASLHFDGLTPRNNLIRSIGIDSFEMGNDQSVNGLGTAYYWLAFGNPGTKADLALNAGVDNSKPAELQTVSLTLTAGNNGPEAATGVEVATVLPAGLTLQTATPSQGTYEAATGLWTVGNLALGQSPTLSVVAQVEAGAGGRTLSFTGTITSNEVADYVPANNAASVEMTTLAATGADLQVSLVVDDSTPDEGQTVTYVVSVVNHGPDGASNVLITDLVPAALSVLSAVPNQGSYDAGTGVWDVTMLGVGEVQTLTISATVQAGTSGGTISNTAALTALDQTDPNGGNNSASVDLVVNTVDLQIFLLVDDATPVAGATVRYTVLVTNLGPAAATGVQVVDLLPATLAFQSAVPSQGTYDAGTGIWSPGTLANLATGTLSLAGLVDPAAGGTIITNTAILGAVDQMDADAANNAKAVDIVVGEPGGVDLQLTHEVDQPTPNVGDRITFTVTVFNAGPGPATGVEVFAALPAGLGFEAAFVNKGTYVRGGSKWLIGGLDEGFQAVLSLQATVDLAAAGVAIADTARIQVADQTDPDQTNNSVIVAVTVQHCDLQLAATVDQPAPVVGDTITYRIVVANNGPNAASGVEVTDLLPVATPFVSAAPSRGTYDNLTGRWTLGSLNPALAETLSIRARVQLSAAGTTVTNTAAVTGADQADLAVANNTAAATFVVPGTNLEVKLRADKLVSLPGGPVTYTATLRNKGPNPAGAIVVTQLLPSGLVFQSATPSQGTYAAATGGWTVGGLAPTTSATLVITARVAAGTAGTVIHSEATITDADVADAEPADNTAGWDLTVWADTSSYDNIMWPVVGPATTVQPGAAATDEVLTFAFVNRTAEVDTLHAMTLSNLTVGSGTSGQMDAEWQPLAVSGRLGNTGDAFGSTLRTGAFVAGRARFDRLDWAIPAGDTLTVTVRGAASLGARDAACLRAGIAAAGDLELNGPLTLVGNWPLVSGQSLTVDGFVVAQANLVPRASGLLSIGSQGNLALTVDLPGNGYLDDTLSSLALQNRGTAEPATDIARIEAWADDGDHLFDPLHDTLLGAATYSGDRWQLTGLSVPVPASGRRFYATVDIAETARPTRDIRLSLPAGNGLAVEMSSGNDGPVDAALENPNTLGISVVDRVILSAEWFLSGVALPGADDAPLLQFVISNTYTDLRRLQDLTFTNTTVAPAASAAQRDAICRQVDLRLDANGNGKLDDLTVDPRLASGTFGDVAAGRVTFSGLNLDLPADSSVRLFVTADVGLMTAADGDRIKGQLSSVTDISILPVASVVAAWPLQSGTELVVNGMIREQVKTRAISVLTLGPGEGPVLAMDLGVPANGYATDVLSGLALVNDGSAAGADLQAVELWADDGDGVFNAGADLLLGPLTISGNRWANNVLAQPIPASGLRLFASLTVAGTPRDSVTVNLHVPVDGITVASGNDGPLDQPVPGNGTLVISTSPLRTAVDFTSAVSDTGQAGTITMNVRNAGSEAVTGIVPALEFVSGAGLLVVGAPAPATIASLAPGEQAAYTWPFTSSQPGQVVMQGNAQGLISGGQLRRSIVTPTSAHRIYTPVPHLEMFPTVNLPFSINRGQSGLVPLTLTFKNPGGADVANAQLSSIRLRLLETTVGPGIVPADLLDRIIVSEGTDIYLATTALPTSGDEVDLVFTQPVTITGSEPVTLGLRLDLRLNSSVPSFLISIENATWLVGSDAVNGAGLATVLGQGTFPVRTGRATLVSPAVGLNVAVASLAPGASVPGQANVQLAEINLSQSLVGDSSSAIDVGRLAFIFHGADGRPVPDPATWFSHLSLHSAFQEHFSGAPLVGQDSLVVLQLTAPLMISGSANLVLRLYGDVAAGSPLGDITPLLAPVDNFDARDGNMNNPVPVTMTTGPAAAVLTVLGPASAVTVAGVGAMPAQVSRGTRDLTVLNLGLANPGAAGTSSVMIDTLTLRFFNAARQPLDPDTFLDRLRVMQGVTVVGTLIEPGAADGKVAVPVTVPILAPGAGASLHLSLDVKPDSPTGSIEVVVDNEGIHAIDVITAVRLPVAAAVGYSLPASSGVAILVVPADELRVAGTSLMPPLLAAQAAACPVMELEFTNPAGAGSASISIGDLTLVQAGAGANAPDLSQLLTSVQLRLGDSTVASLASLAPGATSITLVPAGGVLVQAGQTIKLVLEIMLRVDAPPGTLQLALELAGVQAGPPGGGGLVVRILPVSGRAFPFVTEVGNIGGGTLADSYANFPNPFAAGREATTFAFLLPQAARVNLRLMTPHGELVATVIQDEARSAGFYQTDTWPGLNGNGVPVHNGVYLAEIVVQYADGSRERILRKVAVVR